MRKSKTLKILENELWGMRREALEALANFDGDNVAKLRADYFNDDEEENEMPCDMLTVKNGVACIDIMGPLSQYSDFWSWLQGGTSYADILAALDLAESDDSVKSVLLRMNTPGGNVIGVADMADRIANCSKPVVAFVEGYAASCGYWLASAAGKIVCSQTGYVGSIGVYSIYTDTSKADSMAGVKNYEIVASQSPNKIPDPANSDSRARLQSHVDALCDMFISAVARGRGTGIENVSDNFGKGDVVLASDALRLGMIDQVGTLDDAIALCHPVENSGAIVAGPNRINGDASKKIESNKRPEASGERGIKSMDKEKLKAEYPDLFQQVFDEGRASGAATEIARIKGVEALADADSREIVDRLKYDGKTTPEQAALVIVTDHKAKMAAMNAARHDDAAKIPVVSGMAPIGGDDENDAEMKSFLKSVHANSEKIRNGGSK